MATKRRATGEQLDELRTLLLERVIAPLDRIQFDLDRPGMTEEEADGWIRRFEECPVIQ